MYMTALKDKVLFVCTVTLSLYVKNEILINNSLSLVGSRFFNPLQETHISECASKYSLSAQLVGSEYDKISPERP
jgi:hypothetical protein